ncbi:MAG: hypothetical protein ACLQGP_23775 [Isosphaeraceae bacterium]
MAVKKTETKKTSTKAKPEPSPKAAAAKPAPKKAAPKKSTKAADTATKPAAASRASAPQVPAKKPAGKPAPVVKLTDAQVRILSSVLQTKEAGYVGTKAEGRILEALLQKKLIKKGKKTATGSYQFLVTKAGEKLVPAPVAPSTPAPAPTASAAPESSPSPAISS